MIIWDIGIGQVLYLPTHNKGKGGKDLTGADIFLYTVIVTVLNIPRSVCAINKNKTVLSRFIFPYEEFFKINLIIYMYPYVYFYPFIIICMWGIRFTFVSNKLRVISKFWILFERCSSFSSQTQENLFRKLAVWVI